jgi:hypothetical protein
MLAKVGRWSHHDGPESEILSYRASPASITRIAPGRDARLYSYRLTAVSLPSKVKGKEHLRIKSDS